MIVYHVTTKKKLAKYLAAGFILAPVRAWESAEAAERFSKQTDRKIILRLHFPKNTPRLEGHKGQAFRLDTNYPMKGF